MPPQTLVVGVRPAGMISGNQRCGSAAMSRMRATLTGGHRRLCGVRCGPRAPGGALGQTPPAPLHKRQEPATVSLKLRRAADGPLGQAVPGLRQGLAAAILDQRGGIPASDGTKGETE